MNSNNINNELENANNRIDEQKKEFTQKESELAVANKALTFQTEEKEKRTAELNLANKDLLIQSKAIGKTPAECVAAFKELSIQYHEKACQAEELITVYRELRRSEDNQKEYRKGLQEMMFMTSHQVRIPIANIIAILNHLEDISISADERKEMKVFLKEFARSLDLLTRELTTLIYNEGIKLDKQSDI